MVSPTFATIIICSFIGVFGVLIPLLNKKLPDYVSYRWCVVVVILALLIGAVIDFEVLSDEARHIVLFGGLIVAGGYVLLRTAEKIIANGWLKGARIELKKGDASATISTEQAKLGASVEALKLTNDELKGNK